MSTLNEMFETLKTYESTLRKLRRQLSNTRLSQYTTRRNILQRIAEVEGRYKRLYAKYLTATRTYEASLYKPTKAYFKNGFHVTLELSLDGVYYSNPAPKVPVNANVWVRAVIDEAHHGDAGVPRTHDMFRLRWVKGKGYTALDTIPSTGHTVYAVCWPLVIVRKFNAPSSNTKKNFLLDVEAYERVD